MLKLTGFSAYRDMPVEKVKSLTATIDKWFMPLHDIAMNTIRDVTRVEQKVAEREGKPLSLRQLFRSTAIYGDFEETHDEQLQGSDRLSTLVYVGYSICPSYQFKVNVRSFSPFQGRASTHDTKVALSS